ncbi:hypothetical protein [Leifsonia sp. 1010]|uniref:hypothetical protein n=1 Tax=Leifsonia sp. 1010 TaxID=2817769 RepID=UPI0028578F28|nr:hypothetical protein [Leifsonia sp. 1010]MDR6613603.1 hypothetical protein [Leifsonia sp. 1010]
MRRSHLIAVATTAVLALGLVGCSSSSHEALSGDETSIDKYTQTWPKQYSDTTCEDWNNQMTPAQQFAAAADILSSARDKLDGGTGVAPDDLIRQFQSGITNVCVIDSMTLTDASYGLYATEARFHP